MLANATFIEGNRRICTSHFRKLGEIAMRVHSSPKTFSKLTSELSRLSRGSLLHKELDMQNGYIADKQACSSGLLALLLMILAEREEMREEDR
jgi:hypothetical protein